jgi:TRAP-type C4-dicarboxylate transport system substrate-binding protein
MLTAKKVKIVLLVSLFFFIAMPIMIGSHATPVSAKPIELKFAFWMPTKHSLYRVWAKYAKEVEQLTNGQVKITIYAGGALGGPLEQWDMAVGGVADISFFMPGYTAGRFPRSTVFDLPLIAGGTCTVNTAIAQGVYDKYIAPDYKDAKKRKSVAWPI